MLSQFVMSRLGSSSASVKKQLFCDLHQRALLSSTSARYYHGQRFSYRPVSLRSGEEKRHDRKLHHLPFFNPSYRAFGTSSSRTALASKAVKRAPFVTGFSHGRFFSTKARDSSQQDLTEDEPPEDEVVPDDLEGFEEDMEMAEAENIDDEEGDDQVTELEEEGGGGVDDVEESSRKVQLEDVLPDMAEMIRAAADMNELNKETFGDLQTKMDELENNQSKDTVPIDSLDGEELKRIFKEVYEKVNPPKENQKPFPDDLAEYLNEYGDALFAGKKLAKAPPGNEEDERTSSVRQLLNYDIEQEIAEFDEEEKADWEKMQQVDPSQIAERVEVFVKFVSRAKDIESAIEKISKKIERITPSSIRVLNRMYSHMDDEAADEEVAWLSGADDGKPYYYINETSKREMWQFYRDDPKNWNIQRIADYYGISKERAAAIIRLQEMEVQEEAKYGKPLYSGYAEHYDIMVGAQPHGGEPLPTRRGRRPFPFHIDDEHDENAFGWYSTWMTRQGRKHRLLPKTPPKGADTEARVLVNPSLTDEEIAYRELYRKNRGIPGDGSLLIIDTGGYMSRARRPILLSEKNGRLRTVSWEERVRIMNRTFQLFRLSNAEMAFRDMRKYWPWVYDLKEFPDVGSQYPSFPELYDGPEADFFPADQQMIERIAEGIPRYPYEIGDEGPETEPLLHDEDEAEELAATMKFTPDVDADDLKQAE